MYRVNDIRKGARPINGERKMKEHNDRNGSKKDKMKIDSSVTKVKVETPFGDFKIDMKEIDDAKVAISKSKQKSIWVSLFDKKMHIFLGEKPTRDSKYWTGKLGPLMKMHIDKFIDSFEITDEFYIDEGGFLKPSVYDVIEFGNDSRQTYLVEGTRYYQSTTNPEVRFCLNYKVDGDGDHRIEVYTRNENTDMGSCRGTELRQFIVGLENHFYDCGVLNGAFFDLKYNFIPRDQKIDQLIAWDENVREILWREVVRYQEVMPQLKEMGKSNSRGIILAGPPGTGKTMIAKWLAANCSITCILISAEMINKKHDVKSCFELARKLSPSLLIVEDIDTTGALDRNVSTHPLLGEFLQAMDGIVPNNGVITIATTNHSSKIDPALADRAGRFDRIIEVGLPKRVQRFQILNQLLVKVPTSKSITRNVIEKVATSCEGLTGAWLSEVVTSSLINSLVENRKYINREDLINSAKEVMDRRGLAYRISSYQSPVDDSSGVYVQ